MDLQTAWYFIVAFSILMYVVLDGFDLGVGAFHLLARNDLQRRTFLNAIGPVWDGNEVWIVVVIGGVLAGFPNVYATVLSGFYTLLMLLIFGLIFRAVAIEFRSKVTHRKWRSIWDIVFSSSSVLVAFLVGMILGNFIIGVPLDENQDFIGDFGLFFRPYPLLLGILACSLFAMHGAIYLAMKTEGETYKVVRRWIGPSIAVFLFFYFITTVVTLIFVPHMSAPIFEHIWLWPLPFAALAALLNIPYQVHRKKEGRAFLSSCLGIALLLGLFHVGHFPYLVRSTIDPAHNSLTIYNTCSSDKTLGILLIVAAMGVPLIFAYGTWVYRVFRGKVKLDRHSY